MVIAVALLTVAAGFCLFDQDDHDGADHAVAPDLCLGMLAVSLMAIPFLLYFTAGWTVTAPVVAAYIVALRIPDPPPRPAPVR